MKDIRGVVNKPNLVEGLKKRREKKNWAGDLHNEFYRDKCRPPKGILALRKWWEAEDKGFDSLVQWQALRGCKGCTKEKIRKVGRRMLPKIEEERRKLTLKLDKIGRAELWASIQWSDVKPLFDIAQSIKEKASARTSLPPTFGSKMCHFLFPKCYFVSDHYYVKTRGSYERYWEGCKDAWLMCDRTLKKELIAIVKRHIKKNLEGGKTPIRSYPYATKIVEMCVAGAQTKKCSGN